jgi:hypothetical protein
MKMLRRVMPDFVGVRGVYEWLQQRGKDIQTRVLGVWGLWV